MALRLIRNKTKRLEIGTEDWIDVVPEVTRKDFREILAVLPDDIVENQKITFAQSDEFLTAIFERVVKDWSVQDEDGNHVEATPENFSLLPRSAAQIIETAIMEHFNAQEADKETATKSEGDSAEPVNTGDVNEEVVVGEPETS